MRQSALKKEAATRKELEGLYDLWPMIKVCLCPLRLQFQVFESDGNG